MALLVRLHSGLPAAQQIPGFPVDWPAEVQEVPDGTPDPGDGRLLLAGPAELVSYQQARQASYDAWRAAAELPVVKEARFADIDRRTEELIRQGFSFAGKVFSLSANAQQTYTGLYAIRAEPLLQYPVKVNTLDNLDHLLLADAAAIVGFYLTAVGTYRARLDSGTALKDQVRAAADAAAVQAVIDSR